MSITEAAKLLGVSRTHVYKLIERGELRAIRNPLYRKGPVAVPRADVDRLTRRIAESRPPYGTPSAS